MYLSEIKTELEKTGLPVAYHHYENAHAFPYIVYEITDSINLIADNTIWAEIQKLQIDLYTKTKDQALERKVKQTLNDLGLVWSTYETTVQSEDCYAVSFTTSECIEDDIN